MTQRLLRFGVAQCFQGPAQLSLDFRGEDYLVRRGTQSGSAAISLAGRRIIAPLQAAEYSLPGAPTSPTGTICSFKSPDTRYASSFAHALDLAGPNLLRVLLQLALTPTPNFSRPHQGMRTPVKTTRDSHSEQCVSRKKTSAREAVKHKA